MLPQRPFRATRLRAADTQREDIVEEEISLVEGVQFDLGYPLA